ncbi:Heme oxygenase [Nannocystis exedens]|uniref:Heme oxygenase n=1 Tax=Nannocystis exedens TaxID=54 RepID=A0A1I1WGI3_9BACT|nr:biliverdin-producing heme oxygenase [Nannocystis exedens]PCC67703.1 heme oxygenase [Nannocystis exedens]SFD94276.1 Heme oxygenase [Nannocystis exedens]
MNPVCEPLRRLKDDTAALHLRAELHVRILDADATLTDYRDYLAAMLGYHAPLEDLLGAHDGLGAAGFDAPRRRRAPMLAADLCALSDDPREVPRCTALPAVTSLARALGVAYVLEGSTLGGRYILARLPPALAGLRGHATAFLTGHGPETGARWRDFAAIVARELNTPAAEAEAVAGARETFERLIDWLAPRTRAAGAALREAS